MGRGRTHFFAALAALPWPVGLGTGAFGWLAIAHGIPWVFGRRRGAVAPVFVAGSHPFMPLAWVFLGLCVMAAASFFCGGHASLSMRSELESVVEENHRELSYLSGDARVSLIDGSGVDRERIEASL